MADPSVRRHYNEPASQRKGMCKGMAPAPRNESGWGFGKDLLWLLMLS